MSRTWLSIRVELTEGRGQDLWPRPGRIFAAARSHTFATFATAIDDAFARWDRAHLHQFWMADGRRIGRPDPDFDLDDELLDERRLTLDKLSLGGQFAYEFDFGDSWTHLCTVGDQRIDPLETLGITQAALVLGLGRHPGPARASLGQRRWREQNAEEPEWLRPAQVRAMAMAATLTAHVLGSGSGVVWLARARSARHSWRGAGHFG